MACRKYVITNNTSEILVFSYQECANNMWEYDIVLEPNQIRNLWLVNGTFQAAQYSNFTIEDEGVFPALTPTPSSSSTTPTPTPSNTATVTPSITSSQTNTPTPSNTATVTPSITSSETPTPTPTITPSQTPSFNFVVSNINTGGTYVQGVTGTTGTITTKSGYSYPVDNGETVYADFTTSGGNLAFDVEFIDPSLADFQVRIKINGSTTQIGTPGPGNIILSFGPYSITASDVVEVILEDF